MDKQQKNLYYTIMKKARFSIVFLLIFLLGTFTTHAQQEKQAKKYIIPFQLTAFNNISVKAILNDKDTIQLMLHTAANDITLTEATTARLKTLVFNGSNDSVKSWGGQANVSRFSNNNSLRIGDLHWTDLEISENRNSGQNTDGKFGLQLFAGKVVELDFDRNVIVVSTTLPRKVKKYERLPLLFKNDNMFVQARCSTGSGVIDNKFLIHSGYAGAMLLDDQFAADNKLGEQLRITGQQDLKDSYGNVLKTTKAIMPILTLGHYQLHDVPAGFFEGAIGRQKMSIIGGDILRRFNWVINAERDYIFLKPNKQSKSSYLNS